MSNVWTCTLAAGEAAAAGDGQSAHRPTDAREGAEVHQGIEKYVLTLFVCIRNTLEIQADPYINTIDKF